MKSVSILTLCPPASSAASRSANRSSYSKGTEWELTEVARHYSTLWSSAVTCIGDNEWLVADMEGNLVVLRRDPSGVTADDRKRLQTACEGRLGEVVNTIVPIKAASTFSTSSPSSTTTTTTTTTTRPSEDTSRKGDRTSSSWTPTTTTATGNGASTNTKSGTRPPLPSGPAVIPKAFLATVEGGVYMMGSLTPAYQHLLMTLQTAMARRVQAPGYMPWERWRAFKTEVREGVEPFRFVDGELLDCALDFDEAVLEEICAAVDEVCTALGRPGAGIGVDQVRGLIESLRRLR